MAAFPGSDDIIFRTRGGWGSGEERASLGERDWGGLVRVWGAQAGGEQLHPPSSRTAGMPSRLPRRRGRTRGVRRLAGIFSAWLRICATGWGRSTRGMEGGEGGWCRCHRPCSSGGFRGDWGWRRAAGGGCAQGAQQQTAGRGICGGRSADTGRPEGIAGVEAERIAKIGLVYGARGPNQPTKSEWGGASSRRPRAAAAADC